MIILGVNLKMPRFNIAYLPKHQLEKFIRLADSNKTKKHNYCLGKNSLPHVTVTQFIADENELEEIWTNVCSSINEHNISLTFKKFSNISFDGTVSWLSLLPEPNEKLMDTFKIASKIVKPIRMDEYDPHLTLFNYQSDKAEQNLFPKSGINIERNLNWFLEKAMILVN